MLCACLNIQYRLRESKNNYGSIYHMPKIPFSTWNVSLQYKCDIHEIALVPNVDSSIGDRLIHPLPVTSCDTSSKFRLFCLQNLRLVKSEVPAHLLKDVVCFSYFSNYGTMYFESIWGKYCRQAWNLTKRYWTVWAVF